ncbi:MAG: DUF692 family multinuclear iron-containing protein [Rhodospirillaceae bacterium]
MTGTHDSWLDRGSTSGAILVGLTNGPATRRVFDDIPDGFDFVEVSYEQLQASPDLLDLFPGVPVILHCASLSLAGTVPPDAKTVAAIAGWVERTRTPWLGEHLAFITAPSLGDGDICVDVGFTVGPQLGDAALEAVTTAVTQARERLKVPVLVENPPVYFSLPGSTMTQIEFLCALDGRVSDGLLLDLAHLVITAGNTGADPEALLEQLPLERVREVHLSGVRRQNGILWDDHARLPPDIEYELLARLLRRARPTAVTFELNWPASIRSGQVGAHLARLREVTA